MSDHGKQHRDIANMIDALNITGTRRRIRRQPRKSLGEALQGFNEAAVAFLEHATKVTELLRADGLSDKEDVEPIYTVHTRAVELGRVARRLNESAVQAIVRKLISFGEKTFFNVGALLEHFRKPIEKITLRIIEGAPSGDMLLKTAQECYHQATKPSGDLDIEGYLDTSDPSRRKEKREDWIKFWIQLLCSCPGGPTLFQPEENVAFNYSATMPPKHMPRYLFRAYDDCSTGRNDEEIIASRLSQDDKASRHKVDIFSMDYQEASEMLHQHLDKGLFSSRESDNLVSWSSSLMFVIQYANYRPCKIRNNLQSDVYICAVDTSKFPRGQFAQSKWLLQSFKRAKFRNCEIGLRNLRLNKTEYDNGEYLSQGVLHLGGRSCTFSMQDLTDAGLWDLYPAFNIRDAEPTAPVRNFWTNYVLPLRESWSLEKETTKEEIGYVVKIAKECFLGFDPDKITVLLLAFRQRKLNTRRVTRTLLDEPVEVRRYVILSSRLSRLADCSGKQGLDLFEQLYKVHDI